MFDHLPESRVPEHVDDLTGKPVKEEGYDVIIFCADTRPSSSAIQTREAELAAKLAGLREAVAVGVADIEDGRYTEFADATSLRTHITAISKRVRAKHG